MMLPTRPMLLCLCAVSSLIMVTSAAPAGPRAPVQLGGGVRVAPKRFARIGPDFKLKSEWFVIDPQAGYLSDGPAGACSTELAFDCFEPDGDGNPTDGRYGLNCGMGSERWLFEGGTPGIFDYHNPFDTNDIAKLVPGKEGLEADRVEFAWYWYAGGSGTSEQCFVAIFTGEDFDDTCTGPDLGSVYDGILYDFGILNSSTNSSWYFADVDNLCDAGLFHQLPFQPDGGYQMILAKDFDPNNGTFTLASCAQPMLWGTKPNNPSQQGKIGWADDNPVDGQHTAPDECYDFTFGLCPEPLGTMVAFYADGGSTQACLDLSVDNLVAGEEAVITITDPAGGSAEVVVLFSLARGSRIINGTLGWCLDLGLALPPDPRDNVICQGVTNAGTFTCTVSIPSQARGVTVHFQAGKRGTCPDSCESSVVTATVK